MLNSALMPGPIRLDHRALLSVNGPEAEAFLQGLLTQSVLDMSPDEKRSGALLTPQGKIIAELILQRTEDGFLIDVSRNAAPALLKRLTLFRLRAQVTLEMRPELAVIAFAGDPDPRSPLAASRLIAPAQGHSGDPAAYHAARIAAGLPEEDIDFSVEEVFPADINLDLTGGIDFRKGCFVGQEVVSRMKRRATARRRTLKVVLPLGAPSLPAPVLAGQANEEIGVLTSAAEASGLARVRIDRMAEAEARGLAFSAGGRPLLFDKPNWLADELAALAAK